MIEQYFGDIPTQPSPERIDMTKPARTEELDSLGATLTTGSTVEATRTSGVCLAGNAPKMLAIVADVAGNAAKMEKALSDKIGKFEVVKPK